MVWFLRGMLLIVSDNWLTLGLLCSLFVFVVWVLVCLCVLLLVLVLWYFVGYVWI